MRIGSVAWSEVLSACAPFLPVTAAGIAEGVRAAPSCVRPEAAFHFRLQRNADGGIDLTDIVGGIPGILSCTVHAVPPALSARWLPPDSNERPVGVIMRRSRREDLHVFYRSRASSLVLCTLPENRESNVMLVSLADDAAIQQGHLGGRVSRIEFSALRPGNYLVVSFPLIDLDALLRRALLLRESREYSEALALLEEVLEVDPGHFLAWTRKGYVLRWMGRSEEAMAAVEEALRINPNCALAWRARGALLRDDAKHREGLDCYLRSLELDPTDHLCWENKGNALLALGREAEAQEAYEKAQEVKELHPEDKY